VDVAEFVNGKFELVERASTPALLPACSILWKVMGDEINHMMLTKASAELQRNYLKTTNG